MRRLGSACAVLAIAACGGRPGPLQAGGLGDGPHVVVFAEPGFPVIDAPSQPAVLPQALLTTTVAELEAALLPGRILVWRHGSAFPAEGWPVLLRFLEAGGSMVVLGGEPFTRPVIGPPGGRVVQPRTLALLKALRLNQCQRVEMGTARLSYGGALPDRTVKEGAWVSILQPRLSDTRDFEHEDGAPGSRDAVVRGLAHLTPVDGDPGFPTAAASLAITRLRGRFAGGQWVFHLLSAPPQPDELGHLLAVAARPAMELRVDPAYGCFYPGERPSVLLRLFRPRAAGDSACTVELEVIGPEAQRWPQPAVILGSGVHASATAPLTLEPRPGLYRVIARTADREPVVTGFWIFDRALFESGAELTFDAATLRRNGRPFPVVGTTVMSAEVHRKFLFEPNAAVWDDTFAELSALHINVVRTGVWSAFRKISLDPHVVDEAWIRALQAYYLSARRHGIAVLFTFFAFMPESFGGTNPYLDPRAVEGQRAYLSTVAGRFAGAREILWDLINEPSFSAPDKLWYCRPNGDPFENDAFLEWLRQRYGRAPQAAPGAGWEALVRARWRLTPDEPIGLPEDGDFRERQVMEAHRPYRAKEYLHFAQDAFEAWSVEMIQAIRQAGSTAAVTVGQDEGGLGERPNPLFHYRVVDFTSMHTWWHNDALLWDGLMARAPGKPLLISETGIMQREHLSGEALRSAQAAADLLSRKIGYAFASGAFGVVQWCYDVNPYMASDNEVAIGLRRTDGSYNPEHQVLRQFAAFVARNRERFESPRPPAVLVVVPSGDMLGPRSLQQRGTRAALQALADCGAALRVVSEYRTDAELGAPQLIVLPSCRGLCERAWQNILQAVRRGAVLHCSGWFETDDAGLPATRLGAVPRALAGVEPLVDPLVAPLHSGAASALPAALGFPLAATESWLCSDQGGMPHRRELERGAILHYALPIDWADGAHGVLRQFYQASLSAAGVPAPPIRAARPLPGIMVRCIEYRDARLVVVINETAAAANVVLLAGDRPLVEILSPAGTARMIFFDSNDQIVDRSHPAGQ